MLNRTKNMGNIKRDKQSSLFHNGCCSCPSGVASNTLLSISEERRLSVTLTKDVRFTLYISPNKTIAYSVNARNTCPMQITK